MESFFFYKITQVGTQHCYIGKTTNPKSRLATHKSNVSAGVKKYRLYETIRETGGWTDEWKFDIISTGEMTRDQARAEEQALCNQWNPNLNVQNPNVNYNREYYLRNQEAIKEAARNKYTRTKEVYKCKKKTSEEMKVIHLKKVKNTGKVPTELTRGKHNIEDEEIREALRKGGW